MTSTLARQLQLRASAQALPAPRSFKGTPSLLWDFKRAGDVEILSVHELASKGLSELCSMDARFSPFKDTLFNRASVAFIREAQTADVLAKLDETINKYMLLLVDYFLTPAAFQTLEYLIRRFKVHQHNVDELLRPALPYHATPEFVRLVQVLALKRHDGSGRWGWLAPVQDSGAPVPRDTLVLRCANDAATFKFICEAAEMLGGDKGSSTFLAFYAALLTEVVATTKVDETFLQQLLPFLLAGLGAGACDDYRAGTLMALAQLSEHVQLGGPFLEVVVSSAIQNVGPSSGDTCTVLLVLSHLAATQEHFQAIPYAAFKALLSPPKLDAMAELYTRRKLVTPLLEVVAQSLAQELPSHPQACAKHLLNLLAALPADAFSGTAEELAQELLDVAAAALAVSNAGTPGGLADAAGGPIGGRGRAVEVQSAVQHVLRSLELRYPAQVDAAVNSALQDPTYFVRCCHVRQASASTTGASHQPISPSTPAGLIKAPGTASVSHPQPNCVAGPADMSSTSSESSGSDVEEDEDDPPVHDPAETAASGSLFDFIHTTFEHTAVAPLTGNQGTEPGHTLASALDAPAAALRSMALKRLQQLVDTPDTPAPAGDADAALIAQRAIELHSQLQKAALKQLADDDWDVVASALSLQCVSQLPPQALSAALLALQPRLATVVLSDEKLPSLKAANKAAHKVVKAHAELAARFPGHVDAAVLVLLGFLAPARRSSHLEEHALRAAATIAHPLLRLLPPLVATLGDQQDIDLATADEAASTAHATPSQVNGSHTTAAANGLSQKRSKRAAAPHTAANGGTEEQRADVKLLRGAVSALGAAIAADAATAGMAAALVSAAHSQGSTLGNSGVRARLLLVLALHHAVAGARLPHAPPAAALSNTPAKVGSKASTGAPSHAGAVGSSAAHELLLRVAVTELQDAAAAAAAPADWQVAAARYLDATALPLAGLHSAIRLAGNPAALTNLYAVLLRHALLAATELAGAPAAADVRGTFVTIATLQPAGAYQPHLSSWLHTSVAPGKRAAVLAELAASPEAPTPVACAALALLTGQLGPVDGTAAARKEAATHAAAWLPHVLAPLQRPEASVRMAATQCLQALAGALEGAVATAPVATLLQALLGHRKLLVADAGAAPALVQAALPGAAAVLPPAPAATPAKKRRAQANGSQAEEATGAVAASQLHIANGTLPVALASLAGLLGRLSPVSSDSDAFAALGLLTFLYPAAGSPAPAQLLASAVTLLRSLLAALASGSVVSPVLMQLGALLVALFKSDAPDMTDEQLQVLVDALAPTPQATSPGSVAAAALAVLRHAALKALSPALFQRLSPDARATAFSHVLHAASRGAFDAASLKSLLAAHAPVAPLALASTATMDLAPGAVRGAAREALEVLPLTDDLVTPSLEAAMQAATAAAVARAAAAAVVEPPAPGKRLKPLHKAHAPLPAAVDATQLSAVEAAARAGRALEPAVMVLELLQWKTDVQGVEELVVALQDLLAALLPSLTSIAQPHHEGVAAAAAPAPGIDGNDTEDGDVTAAVGSPAMQGTDVRTGYAAQLAVSALAQFAQRCAAAALQPAGGAAAVGNAEAAAALSHFDLKLAIRCAEAAQDGVLRNEALGLLATLASALPEETLDHVLEVLVLVNTATSLHSDSHSLAVAATALAAVVPAWLRANRSVGALWGTVVDALPDVPAQRRLRLLQSLLSAMPKDATALGTGLLLLLKMATDSAQGVDASAGDAAGATAQEPPAAWAPALAAALLHQVPPPLRVGSLAQLLESAMEAAHGQPSSALPRLAVAFSSAQLKVLHPCVPSSSVPSSLAQSKAVVAAAAPTSGASSILAATSTTPEQVALQDGCHALMRQVLQQLQQLHSAPASADGAPAPAAMRQQTVRATSDGLHSLLRALQSVMATDSYLVALVQLAQQPSDQVKRRALRLYAAKLRGLGAEVASLAGLPLRSREAAHARLATAALSICSLLPELLLPETAPAAPAPTTLATAATPVAKGKAAKAKKAAAATAAAGAAQPGVSRFTRQAALVATSEATVLFGATAPATLLAALPAVLSASRDPHAAVRGSALATVAVIARAAGQHLVPHLPAVTAAILAAADAARSRLGAVPAASTPAPDAVGQDSDVSDVEEEASEQRISGASSGGVREDSAAELAAALAALGALLDGLGAFLSPYVPSMLQLVLAPEVLACSTAQVAGFAKAIRLQLPVALPARLLLEPLLAALQPSIEAGIGPLSALLELVSALAGGLDARSAAAHHEQLFALLLRALDVRRRASPALAGHVHEAEQAAVGALVSLVMKLSEATFKPLFLRLLEWAATPPADDAMVAAGPAAGAGGSGGGSTARLVALMGACCALAERLRSVFVPYYRYLLDIAVHTLDADAPGARPKKKRRSQLPAPPGSDVAAGQAAEVDDTAGPLADRWLLRLQVVRALSLCFAHDTVGFLDQDRFKRLLAPLVLQLHLEPPADIATQLSVQCPASTAVVTKAAPGAQAAAPLDVFGAAVSECLVMMAVAAGSDAAWKPLNHQVLMATRSPLSRTRLVALCTVSALVRRLREEYLGLLPEALPFLAELLEDGDAAIEAECQTLLAALEDVSGEKLDQYLK